MAERNPQAEMPFLEHLEELRWRILYTLIAVTVGTVVGWFVVTHFDVLELLKRPIAPYLPGGRLTFTSPTEPFMLTIKLAFAVGVLLASPVVIYQAWAFLAPALYSNEKRLIVPALSVGVVLFLAGAAAAYLVVLPAALEVLFEFQRGDLTALITIDRYFGFAVPLILAFGLVTELPLVVAILAALGLVTPRFLARNRRYALVIAAFGAALLTPPDAVSMLMMMVPLVLLYEVGILAAWVAARRRARRTSLGAGAVTLGLMLLAVGADPATAQAPPARRPARAAARDTLPPGVPSAATARDSVRAGQPIDTATARRLGLPTGPTRSFPPSDAVLDSLLRLQDYIATRYLADTLTLEGDSQVIILRGRTFIEREGTQLEADSVRYREAACRLDALGEPKLFDEASVLVAESMRYDTCRRRGIVTSALTDFEQQGTDWFMRGDLAVDSGSTRLYGAGSDVTSCDLPEPHYHFSAGKVKWLNRNVMVARPAVLYIRDVPILWMPFIFQDIRSGRRSGMLVPRFGVNDLVRTSGDYRRHVANVGYYLVVNDYLDVLGAVDWSSGNYMQYRAQASYRVLDRFLNGTVAFTRINQLDEDSRSTRIGWDHRQRFSSRSSLTVGIDYATSTRVIQQNTINPFLSTAQLNSSVNFDQRFAWGALNIGGTYQQNLQNDVVSQNIPSINLTPSPVNIGSSVTWSPGLTFRNSQTLNNSTTVEGLGGVRDTVKYDTRNTTFALQTPLRIGRWNWTNAFLVTDVASDQQRRFVLRDSAGDPSPDTLVFAQTFSTGIDWQTGINLPQLFSGSWKLQPGVSIVNTTGAGPFMLRNQFSGGEFVLQGKRPQFSLGMRPTLFGFFPGLGPLARIRHSFSPIVDYRYAPGAQVPEEYQRVVDPEGTALNSRTDPQQTVAVGLSQAFEGKLRSADQDSASAADTRKLRLLTINTSSMEYNFEAAKQPGRTGWQTQRLTNSFSSDLLPGFQLSLAHNLWDGPVGYDSTRFDPFLENVSASFQLTASTVRSIAGLFGIAVGGGGRRDEPVSAPDTPSDAPLTDPSPIRGYQGYGGYPGGTGYPGAFGPARGGGRGFSVGVQYSSSRPRPTGTPSPTPQGGQRNVNLNVGFSPTRHWSLSWTTNYDLDTERFGQHYLRFERDLHRWTASFAFVRSPNGNVAFNFYVSLTDLPDIKFDYDQQTY